MWDSTKSLIPEHINSAILICCEPHDPREMERLLESLRITVVDEVVSPDKKPNPATFIGEGKVSEVAERALASQVPLVVIDTELTPRQVQNLEEIIKVPILDRPGVILEIFHRNARSNEAKTQVELARLEYILPRLSGLWTHFERQRGGGVGNRGMGEKQFEVDRRLIRVRMDKLRERLAKVVKSREERRKSRRDLLKVALLGYTNAGKSTLLNALTQSEVLAQNKLFATLDASIRLLTPDSHPPVAAVDTVGFVSRLPHGLVASFRSTLEEIKDADLILHVVDGSSEFMRDEIEVALQVLEDLNVEGTPRMTVFNKSDLMSSRDKLLSRVLVPKSICVSALVARDVSRLREAVLGHFQGKLPVVDLLIPFDDGKSDARVHEVSVVEKKKPMAQGMFYRVRISDVNLKKFKLDQFQLASAKKRKAKS